MNINNIKEIDKTDDIWKSIFDRQTELMKKYRKIELEVMKIPQLYGDSIDYTLLDSPIIQLKIKEYLWRISEELGESYECVEDSFDDQDIDVNHQLEELGDSLHFFVELLIELKFDYSKIPDVLFYQSIYNQFYQNWDQYDFYLNAFTGLAKVGNCLKNKPWKKTQIRLDEKYMFTCLIETLKWILFIYFVNKGDFYQYYMKKSEVNKFRIETNY